MSTTPPRQSLGFALGFIGVVIFAATLPVTRVALGGFSPWFITFSRAVFASVFALAALLITRSPILGTRRLETLLASLFLVIGFPSFANVALQTVPASHGGVVLGILPLTTALFAALFAGERMPPLFWLSSFAGTGLVVGFSLRAGGGGLSSGDALLFLASVSASIGYVISGRLSRETPGWIVISRALVFALPLTLTGTIALLPADFSTVTPAQWSALAYLGFGSMWAGFVFWNIGLAMGGIARVGQVQLLQTFLTIAMSAVLLREAIGWETIATALAVAAFI
ncbi:MAG: DMT family transporter, partial [Rhizobiaceae bacterium]